MRQVAYIAACLVAFVLVGALVFNDGPLARLDANVTQWMVDSRTPWLTRAMLVVADAHRTLPMLLATATVALFMTWRHGWRSALLLGSVPTGMLLNVGLKEGFQRGRPVIEEPLVNLVTYSFPSGHGVASTLFYGSVCALVLAHQSRITLRQLTVAVTAIMVVTVCFSRVYLGAHYLSDVVAAVAVGLAWLLAWTLAVDREPEEEEESDL